MSDIILGNVALGRAKQRYLTDAEFHERVDIAVEVVMGERESDIFGSFRRTDLSIAIATEAAAVALSLYGLTAQSD